MAVDVARAHLRHRARTRIKRHLMAGCKAEVAVIPKRCLRSIAVMNIKIQHSNTRQPMRGVGVIGGDGGG